MWVIFVTTAAAPAQNVIPLGWNVNRSLFVCVPDAGILIRWITYLGSKCNDSHTHTILAQIYSSPRQIYLSVINVPRIE